MATDRISDRAVIARRRLSVGDERLTVPEKSDTCR